MRIPAKKVLREISACNVVPPNIGSTSFLEVEEDKNSDLTVEERGQDLAKTDLSD